MVPKPISEFLQRETQRKAKVFKDQKKKALILYQFSKRSLEGNNFLLWYNWHITLYQFQLYNIRIQYLYTLWNEHHSRSCYSTVTKFFPSNESFKRSILQNFQIYNAELLTIVTMTVLISPGCISNCKFVSFDSLRPCLPPATPLSLTTTDWFSASIQSVLLF